jgi:hypothetical protein
MTEEGFALVSPGLYKNREGVLCVRMSEFLAAHNLPDAPEVRQVVLDNIKREFGNVPLKEID